MWTLLGRDCDWPATSPEALAVLVLGDPDPQAGDTLADPNAVVPSRGTLRGSAGVFTCQVPANSLTVMQVAR